MLRGCLGFLQTSTYQAVLTTDGNRSFALLLYQDGGMRWDYTKLAAADVLIGFSRCCMCVTVFWDSRDLFQHGFVPALCWDCRRNYPQESPAATHRAAPPHLNPFPCKLQEFPPQLLYGERRRVVLEG